MQEPPELGMHMAMQALAGFCWQLSYQDELEHHQASKGAAPLQVGRPKAHECSAIAGQRK